MIELTQWRCVVGAWSTRIAHRYSQPIHSVKWQSSSLLNYSDLLLSGLYLLVYSVAGSIRGVNRLLSVALVTTLLLLLCGDVERNPGPSNYEFLRVFEKHLGVLIEAVSDPIKLANDMFSHGLVPDAIKNAILTTNDSHYNKSSTLLNTFHGRLKALDGTRAKEDLVTLCKVIGDLPITREILKDISVNETVLFEDIVIVENNFIQIMREKASSSTIFQSEWPPPIRFIDKNYFGRLMLLERSDDHQGDTAWYHTRGHLDRKPIPHLFCSSINVNDILDDSKPGIVLIDGPPGIGKTTLCRKIRQMWATEELKAKFKLALLISLRQREVVNATKLDDLMQAAYKDDTIPSLCEHFHKNNGKGLLFIFDGWDEFPEESKQRSFVSEIITRNRLYHCTVIVTSRSYASESLLQLCCDESINKHVQILGFSNDEVHEFIKAAFKENEAKSLISELELRNDISSICCIPVVCFMLIFVYKKMKKLPHSMTELYTNFILYTIKREVVKQSGKYLFSYKSINDIHNLPSPLNECLNQLTLFSYNMLKELNPTLVFDSQGLSQLTLAQKNTYLGLMTSFQYYDDDCYQFIHLTIQEYLAALWMSKQPDCHELFRECFNLPHFHMALRFVAGLTNLNHPSYDTFFSVPINLKCKTIAIPMFAQRTLSEMKTNEYFSHQNFFMEDESPLCIYHTDALCDPFHHLYDKLDIRLLYFLYESQNIHLCEILALSISDFSICTHLHRFSAFDWYCIIYFLTRSSKKWTHLHLNASRIPLEKFPEKIQTFSRIQNKCTCNCLCLENHVSQADQQRLQNSVLTFQMFECKSVICSYHTNVDDFYSEMNMIVYEMPGLEELHMSCNLDIQNGFNPNKSDIQASCFELSEIIAKSQTLKSLEIKFKIQYGLLAFHYFAFTDDDDESPTCFVLKTIKALLRKVKSNKHLQALSVSVLSDGCTPLEQLQDNHERYPEYCSFIEELIRFNSTLKTVQFILPSSLYNKIDSVTFRSNNNFSTVNVGFPLLSRHVITVTTISQLRRCSNLHYIHFFHPLKEKIIDFISKIPTFKSLRILHLETHSIAIDHSKKDQLEEGHVQVKLIKELCHVMKNNKSVQALKVTASMPQCTHECGVALKQLLQANRTLECFELHFPIPNNCLHYIQSGLQHNTTLKELTLIVFINVGEDLMYHPDAFFFKSNLKSMIVYLDPSTLHNKSSPVYSYMLNLLKILSDPLRTKLEIFYTIYFEIIPSISLLLYQNEQIESLTVLQQPDASAFQTPDISSNRVGDIDHEWIELAHHYLQQFWKVLRDHPSLKYIAINGDKLLVDDIKRTVELEKLADADIDLLKAYPKIVIQNITLYS